MAEEKNSTKINNNASSGVLNKKKSTGKKTKKTNKTETAAVVSSAPVKEAEMEKTKEIKTVAAATAEKDRTVEKVVESATLNTKKTTAKKEKKEKKERLGFNWFFWLSLILILIPVGYFVKLLHDAQLEGNVPVLGKRLENNIVDKISDSQVESIRSAVAMIEGAEKTETNLIVDTLRISVDTNDELTVDQMKTISTDIYNIINENAPVDTYFTQHDGYKQYDLDIYVFNNLDLENPIIVSLHRNSNMEEYKLQVLTDPVNSKISAELKQEMADELAEEEAEKAAQEAENQQGSEEGTGEGTETENGENVESGEQSGS